MEAIKNYFTIGNIYKTSSGLNYAIESYKECFEYLIPFFSQYPIPSICLKYSNFKIWNKILDIIINKNNNTLKSKLLIRSLISRLNKYD